MNNKNRTIMEGRKIFMDEIKKEFKSQGLWGKKLGVVDQAKIVSAITLIVKKFTDRPHFLDIIKEVTLDPDTRFLNLVITPILAKQIEKSFRAKDVKDNEVVGAVMTQENRENGAKT